MHVLITILLVTIAVAYSIGIVTHFVPAYRWCIKGYDYAGQNDVYNGTAAAGFALVWPLFRYLSRRMPNPS